MARGVVTRVLSVRCNDTDLALCAEFMTRNGVHLETCSDIVKNAIGMMAQQAIRMGCEAMSLQDAREYLAERYGNAGAHRNTHTYTQNAFSQRSARMNVDIVPQKPIVGGVEVTGAQIQEYVTWLGMRNLTSDQCTFNEYKQTLERERQQEINQMVQKYASTYTPPTQVQTFEDEIPAGCDPSLPIAAQDSDEELAFKASLRAEQDRAEREAMEAFNAEVARKLSEGTE